MKNQGQKIRLSDLVDWMMAEQNHNPRDYCFRYVVDRYPKATHDAFDFPGEYVDNLKVDTGFAHHPPAPQGQERQRDSGA